MNSRGSGIVGYNVQAAVDADHHLIIAHEVTCTGSDRAQLVEMADQARAAIGCETISVVADRGYFSGRQFLACAVTGITTYVPRPLTSSGTKRSFFPKQDFTFDAERDLYVCPAGQELTRGRHRSDREGDTIFYRHLTACLACPLKPRCTPEKMRRIRRWEHEAVIDDVQRRLDRRPEMMRVRRRTVEHVFCTIKGWMGATHFLTRTLTNVSTEMSLHVLAYNIKRVLRIIGIGPLIAAITA